MSKLLGVLNSGSQNTASSATPAEGHERNLVRHVLVTIKGNRATWEHMGVHGALWRVCPERANVIFCSDADTDPAATVDRLSRALIKKVTVLETNTNIDEVVAVGIDGLPPKEFTAHGDGAALFLTGDGRTTVQQEVFSLSGNTELGMAWMRQFPRHTASNLEDEGAMQLTGSSYYFVHISHPVIYMIQNSQEVAGVLLTPEMLFDNQWYRLDVEAFLYYAQTIRETILHNAPSTFNLSTLTVRIAKPDGQKWLQFSPQVIDALVPPEVLYSGDAVAIQQAKVLALDRYVDKPLFLTMRIAFEYTLPDVSTAAPPMPVLMQQQLQTTRVGG